MPTVSARLVAEVSGFINPIKAATQATKDLRTELGQAAKEGKLDAVAGMALKAGFALSSGFLVATTAAARFEKQMSEVNAVSGATGNELDALSKAALQAGRDTVFSATEAAKAEAELAKAGISTADILGGALKGSLSLASAGSLDLAEAADVAAKAMNIFDLEGKDVEHVADVLASAANKSATDVHELGFALRMSGLAAKAAGLTLEETTGTLALFADNALTGSDAGTSLKSMLSFLAAPSKEAATRMKELGINAFDAQGQFVGIAKLAGILQTQLKGLTQEQRNEAIATIFGMDAMRAANVLFNEGEQTVRDYTAAVNDQGAAAETAAKKTDNLMGDIERLTGALESLFIESASGSNSGLRVLVQGLTSVVDIIGKIPGPILTAGTVLIGLSGAGLLAFSTFIKLRKSVGDTFESMREAGPTSARLATGLEKTSRWATRAALAFGALTIAGMTASSILGKNVNVQVDALAESLSDFGKNGKAAGEGARVFGDDMADLQYDLKTLGSGFWTQIGTGIASVAEIFGDFGQDQSLIKAKERISGIDAALASLVQAGRTEDAAAAFEELAAEAEKAGISVDDLKAGLPAYAAAMQVGGKSTGKMGDEAAGATQDLKKLAEQQQENIGKAFDLEEAQDRVKDSTADLRAQIKEQIKEHEKGAGTLDANTDAGRRNRESVRELTRQYQDLIEKTAAEGKSTTALRVELEKTLVSMGFSKDEAHRYAGALGEIPGTVPTTLVFKDEKALADAAETHSELYRMYRKPIYQQIIVTGPGQAWNQRWGGITEHAQTGLLSEAGVFAARSPARYAFAEPGTGGEAFIPRRGDYGRSMAILSRAAAWYGAAVTPRDRAWQGGLGGGGTTVVVNNTLNVTAPVGSHPREIGAEIMKHLRIYEQGGGRTWSPT